MYVPARLILGQAVPESDHAEAPGPRTGTAALPAQLGRTERPGGHLQLWGRVPVLSHVLGAWPLAMRLSWGRLEELSPVLHYG